MNEIRERIVITTAALLDAARCACMPLSGDERVAEVDAAALLGLSRAYLKQLRDAGEAPPHFRAPVNGSRISYRVADLAAWIEVRRE